MADRQIVTTNGKVNGPGGQFADPPEGAPNTDQLLQERPSPAPSPTTMTAAPAPKAKKSADVPAGIPMIPSIMAGISGTIAAAGLGAATIAGPVGLATVPAAGGLAAVAVTRQANRTYGKKAHAVAGQFAANRTAATRRTTGTGVATATRRSPSAAARTAARQAANAARRAGGGVKSTGTNLKKSAAATRKANREHTAALKSVSPRAARHAQSAQATAKKNAALRNKTDAAAARRTAHAEKVAGRRTGAGPAVRTSRAKSTARPTTRGASTVKTGPGRGGRGKGFGPWKPTSSNGGKGTSKSTSWWPFTSKDPIGKATRKNDQLSTTCDERAARNEEKARTKLLTQDGRVQKWLDERGLRKDLHERYKDEAEKFKRRNRSLRIGRAVAARTPMSKQRREELLDWFDAQVAENADDMERLHAVFYGTLPGERDLWKINKTKPTVGQVSQIKGINGLDERGAIPATPTTTGGNDTMSQFDLYPESADILDKVSNAKTGGALWATRALFESHEALRAQSEAFRVVATKALGVLPVAKPVGNSISDVATSYQGAIGVASGLEDVIRKLHKDDIERLEAMRNNEEMWSVANNGGPIEEGGQAAAFTILPESRDLLAKMRLAEATGMMQVAYAWQRLGMAVQAQADAFDVMARRIEDEMPFEPEVAAQVRKIRDAYKVVIDAAYNVWAQFQLHHEKDLRRHDTPRRGEGKWDPEQNS